MESFFFANQDFSSFLRGLNSLKWPKFAKNRENQVTSTLNTLVSVKIFTNQVELGQNPSKPRKKWLKYHVRHYGFDGVPIFLGVAIFFGDF